MSWNNQVHLIGRLTKDPVITGIAVRFTLAVNRPKQENKEEQADFIPCVVFGKLNEIVLGYKKGDELMIDGTYRTGSYKDKDNKTVYTTDVACSIVKKFATNVSENKPQQDFRQKPTTYSGNAPKAQNTQDFNIADEDLPF